MPHERFTMFVAKIMTRLLWTVGYPYFSPLTGKYRVGAIQERLPDSVACQIHYPTHDKKSTTFVPYFRPQAIDGLADYSRTPSNLLTFLTFKRHPCVMNAEPIVSKEERFPIVLFSHGLAGSMEMYTQLCQQIASEGFVVVAMEHEDGSGMYAEDSSGKPIKYKRPDDTPYSRQKVLNFRKSFLQERVEDATGVLDTLLNQETASNLSPRLQEIVRSVDTSKGISFVGHSFGGASMIMAAQKCRAKETSDRLPIKSLCLLDPWAFSLEDKVLEQGMPSLPTLSILSEGWATTNPETKQVDQFLRNCEDISAFYIPKSAHASFSDTVSWLPRFIGRRLYLRGKQEKKHVTIPMAAKACVQHIRAALKGLDTQQGNEVQSSDNLRIYDRYRTESEATKVSASN